MIDTSCREAVITRHPTVLVRHDECSRCARLLVSQRVAVQPLIENLDTAIERFEAMFGRQGRR